MGLIDDIKKTAYEGGTKIQNSKEQLLEAVFNSLFYAPKNPEEETKFVHQMFTRGGDSHERIGLHTSAIIVGEDTFCIREQVLSLLYKQKQGENVPIKLKRIFEEGNAIHEKWQRLFIRGGLGQATDMDFSKFNKKYEVGYTPDAIITIPNKMLIDGKELDLTPVAGEHVVEIKSVNTYQFQKLTSHPTAVKQVQMYLYFAKKQNAIILCDDKNTQDFKVFCTTYNKDIIAPYIDRLEAVQYYKQRVFDEGKMVGRCKQCSTKVSKRALGCAMRDACWNVGQGRVKLNV